MRGRMKYVAVLLLAGACSLHANAQSSVTLYGTVDVNGRYVKNDATPRRLSLSTDGLNSSQLGFRGVEDLGAGLKAGFTLLASVAPDTGSISARFWNRRSTVSLFSNAGEVRLGRDWNPTFWNNVIFDAFGGVGVGNSFNVLQMQEVYAGSPALGNFVRNDNSIGYFLPADLGGVYGQAMVAASEGATNQGRYLGARLGFAAGALDVAAAFGMQRSDLASNPAVTGIGAGSEQRTINVGGAYTVGPFKVMGYLDRDSRPNIRESRGSVSGVMSFGLSEIHIGYDRSRLSNGLAHNSNTDTQVKATYQYNLSKRTATYVTTSRLENGAHPLAGVTQSVAGLNAAFAGSAQSAAPIAGGKSTGAEFGIRHFF